MEKNGEIKVRIQLDDKQMPSKMEWSASGLGEGKDWQPCKAMLLSLFDEEKRDTLKIDLWTTQMQVIEMDRFFYQSLRALADTYHRATGNQELAIQMQQFAQYFAEKTELIPPS